MKNRDALFLFLMVAALVRPNVWLDLGPGPAAASETIDMACGSKQPGVQRLGTARQIEVGTQGGLQVGLKTYPRDLALADHEIVLTFDDGPWPTTTPKILDALAAQCVKATFFLIGRNAQAAPALVRREIAEGHTVGHHTFSHPGATLRGIGDIQARADIDKGFTADDKAAYGKADAEPRVPFFRFPGFADTPALNAWLSERNIGIFGTDLWASDWLPMTPEAEEALVLGRIEKQGRGIVLMHDSKASTAAMLPKLLEDLRLRGFRIVHLVPGSGKTETMPAPAGWTSETEAIIETVLRKHAPSRKQTPAATPPRSAEPLPQ
ncbi:polysaccharide deacetylase family protein [Beijerinckia indica]|uniref:Chitooligosaccharide deacetylase n=1 Tax=Beijerinckia indica subsp. indica (strain ATCC 9039 / DSM 1715 / NCIMB 8712) TaxID=395963 RepID=B2IBZ6_BEII9|nr:polysaccharide deacetylase family protein [Beijerinckia indica]ACB95251.1 polysaccharide deacetylase [Beijerinckia indica subsp. indica ATCC 9039]